MRRPFELTFLLLCLPSIAAADPPPRSFLDRTVVATAIQRAISRAGLGSESVLEQQRRVRLSALLPRVSVRIVRSGLFAAPSVPSEEIQPTTQSPDDGFTLDARLELDLPRLVFAQEELTIARTELQRYQLRTALEREVVDQLAALERIRTELAATLPGSNERIRSTLEYDRHRARIEVLTGSSIDQLLRQH